MYSVNVKLFDHFNIFLAVKNLNTICLFFLLIQILWMYEQWCTLLAQEANFADNQDLVCIIKSEGWISLQIQLQPAIWNIF